jgi:glycosyltransferase involved in cell wall biosynthesis
VEWFSSSFPGAPAEEQLEGIRLVRAGRQWTVHWRAFRRYRVSLRNQFDAVIDEVNTMPFFTPLWAGIPTFMLIFQLAREVWWYESPFPINLIGYVLEPLYLMPYRKTTAFTISKSTVDDLLRMGFRSQVALVPIGVDSPPSAPRAKASTPTFLYVGRLAPSKRISHALQALAHFRAINGAGTLWVVGSGSRRHEQFLVRLAQRLNIDQDTVFWGRVSPSQKWRLMGEAHALLMTSVREGWGLVVAEANACGTPAIVYDVPGLRDSVRHDCTGLVVKSQPAALADAMSRLIDDQELYGRLATEGRRWSGTFSFDDAARRVERVLEEGLTP